MTDLLAGWELDDSWLLFEGRTEGQVVLVRVRDRLEPMVGHPHLGTRIRIVWGYAESGLPDPRTMDLLARCEGLLVEALESRRLAVLTHVLVGEGLRQWVFYASDTKKVAERLNDVLPHDPPYPIELTAESDPEWTEYTTTLGSRA